MSTTFRGTINLFQEATGDPNRRTPISHDRTNLNIKGLGLKWAIGQTGKLFETGTYSSTAGQAVTLSSSNNRPFTYLADDNGVALTGDVRSLLSRVYVSVDQSSACTLNAMRAQIKLADTVDISHANCVVSPFTAYFEMAGTSARTLTGHVAAMRTTIEEGASGTTTIAASSYYAGLECTLNSTRTYTETGTMGAIVINISGGTSVWPNGIYIDSGACTRGIDIQGATRAINIESTPASADRQLYMDIDYGANNKEAAYIISSSAKTSGETTAIRARGQGKAVGASTAEIRGVHSQGIAFAALYTGTVNALYAEAIAKGTSTVTTIRGAMIACDSESTPTSIGTMLGAHVRIKTSVAPGTAFEGLRVESEKFGSGVLSGAAIRVMDTTWGAAEIPFTTGLYLNTTGIITTGVLIASPTVNAISITGVSTGSSISVTNTALTAGDSYSGVRVAVTAAACNNAYGLAGYFDSTLTGTQAGHTYNTGSWINLGATFVDNGSLLVPYEGGIYDAGGTLTTARIVLSQFQAILSSNPASIHVCRLNYNRGTGADAITAVFAAANSGSIGYTTGAGTSGTQTGYIPIADIVGHGVRYIRVYDSAT